MFLATIGVSNEQTYSFLAVADSFLNTAMFIMLFMFVYHFPVSAHPEKAFLRLMKRFFRSCEYLLITAHNIPTKKLTYLQRWKIAFYNKEINTLPAKILTWGKVINTQTLPGTSEIQIQSLTTHLYALAVQLQELLKARQKPLDGLHIETLAHDVYIEYCNIHKSFKNLSHEVNPKTVKNIHDQLQSSITYLENHLETTINKTINDHSIHDVNRENFYLLLGAYKGLSNAIIKYAKVAENIRWEHWQESKF